MRIVSIGGGPAGLYLAILMKKADMSSSITVLERNKPDDTFGFGVVFSDATMGNLADADRESYDEIVASFAHWDDIDIHYRGQVLRSTGHGFAGMSRKRLLSILQRRAAALGIELSFQREVPADATFPGADLVVVADGVNSAVRSHYAAHFGPKIDWRPNRFTWLGTTFPFEAFTFYFKETPLGLFQVHAYRYEEDGSTFIVECSGDTFAKSGLDPADEDKTLALCEQIFEKELQGHRLIKNRSVWRKFPTVKNQRWHHENMVLLGDAAHTAHFSIGSGTKLALEDAIGLAEALKGSASVRDALEAYEVARRPAVDALQRSAQVSLEWFESTPRYMHLDPLTFATSCLTRSLRVTHDNLKKRDPGFVRRVDVAFAERAAKQTRIEIATEPEPPPPMFAPFRLRDMTVDNRVVVSPMCQYMAEDGTPNDWHFVHLASRAIGGAGLVMTEMTDVSRDGRISPGCTGLYKPEHQDAWRRVVEFVHHQTRAKIGVQLGHAGRKGSTRRMWEGIDEPLDQGGWPLLAASPLPYLAHSQVPKEMDRADMDRVLREYVTATRMAQAAGFDLLEVHMAHGYLLASFVSPLTNVRSDGFGGSLEGRMRYPLEVLDAVRAAWPETKPLSVRISAYDWDPRGTQPEESVEIAKMLKAHGCDIVDVSAGQTVAWAKPKFGRLYQTPLSDRIKNEASIATMTVGNVTSWSDVNSILAAGRADLCVLARGHLYDPYWTRHAAHEQGYSMAWPDPYAAASTFTPRSR